MLYQNCGDGDDEEADDVQFLLVSLDQNKLITSPVTVFLKHGQLDLSKASDSISHQLTSIFSETFQIS